MFQALLGHIQGSVQNTVDIIVNRALIGLFFFVAAGLATAAAGLRLANEYGVEVALVVLTALFVLAGLIGASVLKISDVDAAESQTEPAAVDEADGIQSASAALKALSDADRELLLGLLASVAPLVAPRVLGLVVRNIPAMLVIVIAMYVIVRHAGSSQVQSVETAAEATE